MTEYEKMMAHAAQARNVANLWLMWARLATWVADAKGAGLLDGDDNIRSEVGALLDALDRISKGK